MFSPETSPPNAELLLEIAQARQVRNTWEGRFSDYCHACSNRLNSLKLGLYLAQRQPAGRSDRLLEAALEHYDSLEQQFERFRTVCRPLKLSPVPIDLGLLIEDRRSSWTQLMAEEGARLLINDPGYPVMAGLDVDRLGQALDGLIRWRSRLSPPGAVAAIEWGLRTEPNQVDCVRLVWEEYPTTQARSSGFRSPDNPTWVLAVLTRIVTEHGGSVVCQEVEGWRVEMTWPARTACC